ncbi:helix-turn-helix transcriptional regulator [Dactylosporangium aurantiacum]|uniref:helix-turn-helix transcriptional regulator n=1 Tax=Dactylosporangium aurantiacum TaxID=35754 RepID=UPI0005274EBC|nr:helix-turn-helix transcriptional regulator [Dactylosporangium aurantiacum]MDG6107793.1 helix-turn-helix transcriptional regulator [Dactylosporangium aurantiacum]
MSLGEFLRNRRGRVSPAEAGLPAGTGRRQTPGLRREELAALAGVSVDYYTRLERGRDTNPGRSVLDALATVLRLDDDERAHLHRLATRGHEQGRDATTARPALVRLLAMVRPTPAYVLSQTSDLLAANAEGFALLPGLTVPGNLVTYVFTHPAAGEVFVSWQRMAEDCVAHLRAVGDSPARAALVADLCAGSEAFARLWAHYDVRVKSGVRRAFRHTRAGRLELTSEILTAVDGQRFVTFQAAPGSPDHAALELLSGD